MKMDIRQKKPAESPPANDTSTISTTTMTSLFLNDKEGLIEAALGLSNAIPINREVYLARLVENYAQEPEVPGVIFSVSLSKRADPDVIEAAIDALAKASPELLSISILIGLNSSDPYLRSCSISHASRLNPGIFEHRISEIAFNDPDESVRHDAINFLHEVSSSLAQEVISHYIKDQGSLPALKQLCLELAKHRLKIPARETLQTKDLSEDIVNIAAKFSDLSNSKEQDNLKLLAHLIEIAPKQFLIPITLALIENVDPDLRIEALERLNKVDNTISKVAAKILLADSDLRVREKAKQLL